MLPAEGAVARAQDAEPVRAPSAPGSATQEPTGRAAAGALSRVERLSLAECVRRALAAAPELAVARKDVEARRAKLAEAKVSRYLPEAEAINFTGIAQRARGTVLDPLDSTSVSAYGPFTKVEITVVQPLFTGGRISAGIAAATHAVEERIAASDGVAAEVTEQVKTLYYNVLLARSVEGVLEEANDAFESALETARRRRAEGDPSISELDILYLRVGLSEVAKELPRLRHGGQMAIEALRRLMGAESEAPIDLAEKRLEPAPAKLAPIGEYAALLFEQNPQWRQIDAGVLAKAEEVRTVEADYYPNVFLTGSFGYSYAPERDRQLNPFAWDEFNYLRGPGGLLGIRWLLNFHITAAKAGSARAELEKLEAQRRMAQTGLPLELRQAYSGVLQTREALDKLQDGRKAGRAILTLAVTNFDVGVGDARDILDGLGNYSRVSSDYYEAVRDYDLALAALSRVVGEEVATLERPALRGPTAPAPE